MTDDEAHRLTGQRAAHGEETTCGEARVLLFGGDVRHEFDCIDLEHLGVVEQCAVDATLVRTLNVAILVTALFHFRLCTKVGEHLVVLHLSQADDRTTHSGQHRRAHVAQGACHVVEFVTIL